ncbi:MFS transporter [Nocardioides sp. Root1257]|uniref:MFS transporter n=1 Tax=unclassified Nocardioides TaxID=2615069 RepID=UPI0006F25DCC|nr:MULTISPECIES: MFS transporter [unclassified Nocardioides]KQW48004.1 MFS transporter [Nocardioides sp. Root1257]KRC45256.1 MFS transporter [Nocardioides sp. Root224]
MTEHAVDAPCVDEPQYEPDPRRWRILGVSLVIGFMALLDVSIVNVAIPSMQEGLHTSAGTIQWVVSGYALAFGLTLVAGGRLGDAYGRRRLMLIGLACFIVSSAAVGFAPNAALVVLARLAQGASAGLLTPQNSGLIQQLFRGAERGRAFGVFGLTVSVSSAVGPVLGGLIIAVAGEDDGWRWLFLVNVPIGLVAMVAVMAMVPRRTPRTEPADNRIDVPGALLLGATVLCLLYPVVRVEGGARLPLLLLAGVPVFGWAFVAWERRTARRGHPPLLDLRLLRSLPGYVNGLAVGALYFTGFTGVLLVTSLYLQDGLGSTPLEAGLLLMPFALGSAVSAPLAGRVVSDLGRRLTVGALTTMILGVVLVALLVPGHDPVWPWLAPTLLLAGLGAGAVVSPNMTLTLSEVPPRMGGAAGGALQTGQRIGASIGAAVLVTTYQLSGFRAALLTGAALVSLALLMAIRSLRQARTS